MTGLTALDGMALAHELARGATSSVEVTREHLERIGTLDPRIHAFVRLNPRALEEAAEADRMRADGRAGSFTGMPIAIKDNLGTAGLETSCASRLLAGFVPPRDATAVARLRRAGAVVVGKTNMDEFGMGSSTENSAAGPSRNPWDLDRVCGGSSGGSAAAVAARMATVALGSDTGGSIRQPAAFCGVVGVKPSYGRVSRSGLVAYGSSLDQIGPLTRSVRDAAAILEAIAGADPDDATSARRPGGRYLEACRREVRGLRVGLPREYFTAGLDPEVAAAARSAAQALEHEGAVVEEVSLPHTPYAIPAYYLVATAEAASNLARYDGVRYGQRPAGVVTLSDLYRRTRGLGLGPEVRRRIMLGTFALSAGYQEAFYGRAQRVRTLIARDFTRVFARGLNLLLTPPAPTPPFRLGEKLDDPLAMYLSDVFTVPVNLAGVAAMVLPVGATRSGLPLAVQIVSPAFEEETLFSAGAALERAFPQAAPPGLEERAA